MSISRTILCLWHFLSVENQHIWYPWSKEMVTHFEKFLLLSLYTVKSSEFIYVGLCVILCLTFFSAIILCLFFADRRCRCSWITTGWCHIFTRCCIFQIGWSTAIGPCDLAHTCCYWFHDSLLGCFWLPDWSSICWNRWNFKSLKFWCTKNGEIICIKVVVLLSVFNHNIVQI